MSTKDVVTKEYMQLKEVFADLFNFYLHGGEAIIRPEQLHEKGTELFDTRKSASGKAQTVKKYRDLLCLLAMDDAEHSYLLLGIENQTNVHYAMPIRNMLYDALQYREQIRLVSRQHRLERQAALAKKQAEPQAGAKPETPGEFLSGFLKQDRLHPVITLVVYFGADPWDGPRSVHDMFPELSPALLQYIPDYQIHLIEPAALSDEDLGKFQTNLREVLSYIKYSQDKEQLTALMQSPRFHAVRYEAAAVLQEVSGFKLNLESETKGGEVDMSSALEQILEEYRQAGHATGQAAGHAEGQAQAFLTSLQAVMQNLNLDVEEAMNALNIPAEMREALLQKLNGAS